VRASAAKLLDQTHELWAFNNSEEGVMTTLGRPGVPAGGFKTVGQIHATNDLVLQRNQNAMGVAVELLSTHTAGAPVVDERGEFIGFVSEFDILRALEAKKDLNQLTAGDVMAKDRISVTDDTSIEDAVKLMEEKRLLNLPVKVDGKVAYSITRHDLLRAWIGLGVDIESNIAP
jgi:predicted transcriptional regulator